MYEECGQGDLIYPRKDCPQLVQYFEKLKDTKEIPSDIVKRWCRENLINPDDTEPVRTVLERAGYKVCAPGRDFVRGDQMEEINNQVQEEIENRKLNPGMRAFYSEVDLDEAQRTGKLPDNYKG